MDGGSTNNYLASLPVTNVNAQQVSKNSLRVTWELPDDTERSAVQVRAGLNYIPTLPQVDTDYIEDKGIDETETILNVTKGSTTDPSVRCMGINKKYRW